MALSINTNGMARQAARQLNAHYDKVADSTRRLSSGLRVERAADDAAGLAIRELMRADIRALGQGARNANDAISMIQTADCALAVIDEKLIRMKELAEQAATGTYDSTQRLIIDSEFQQMASEIDRIAKATDFNGVKLLDGSLSGRHDGSGRGSEDGLSSTGALKVHFGTANDSAEDYYYVEIGDCTLSGLGLRDGVWQGYKGYGNVPSINEVIGNAYGGGNTYGGEIINQNNTVMYAPLAEAVLIIPAGLQNVTLDLGAIIGGDPNQVRGQNSLNIFTRSGEHIAGVPIADWNVQSRQEHGPDTQPEDVLTAENGFAEGATYDATKLNGNGKPVTNYNMLTGVMTYFTVNGMHMGYSGDGEVHTTTMVGTHEKIVIETVTEDLILVLGGFRGYSFTATWQLPAAADVAAAGGGGDGSIVCIKTQELAQKALPRLDRAIVRKDSVRAHLGAMQNRLENTVTNLNIQAENLQNAESRISDVDVATEMTTFVRNQVLTQSAVSLLAQANAFPHMLLRLLQE